MKKLAATTTLLSLVLFTSGCPLIKPMARTVIDLARNACALYAEQAGLSWEQVCETEEQLRPFIDAILAGQAAAAAARSAGATGECPSTPATTEPVAPPAPAPTTAPVAPPAAPAAPATPVTPTPAEAK